MAKKIKKTCDVFGLPIASKLYVPVYQENGTFYRMYRSGGAFTNLAPLEMELVGTSRHEAAVITITGKAEFCSVVEIGSKEHISMVRSNAQLEQIKNEAAAARKAAQEAELAARPEPINFGDPRGFQRALAARERAYQAEQDARAAAYLGD